MGPVRLTDFYASPIGFLRIEETNGCITRICAEMRTGHPPARESVLTVHLKMSLDGYFAGKPIVEKFPVAPVGTVFQKKVWDALREIPFGQTAAYRTVAQRAFGSAHYARAVAQAAHANPILLLIPCHRMIAADGTLGGFVLGAEAKRFLLKLEQYGE